MLSHRQKDKSNKKTRNKIHKASLCHCASWSHFEYCLHFWSHHSRRSEHNCYASQFSDTSAAGPGELPGWPCGWSYSFTEILYISSSCEQTALLPASGLITLLRVAPGSNWRETQQMDLDSYKTINRITAVWLEIAQCKWTTCRCTRANCEGQSYKP